MSHTILVTAPTLAPAGLHRLQEAGCRLLFIQNPDSAAEVEHLLAAEPVDAVVSRTVALSAKAIACCPTLKVISKHGVGVSNIDVEAATQRRIPVYVTPGTNAQSVAEMTLGLMFAAARRIAWMDGELRRGNWSRAQDGLQLGGRTLGLAGFGQIGQRVAAVCLALGMRVIAFDPALTGRSPVDSVEIASSLEELLAQSDVLSLHVPLTPATRRMIGAPQLAMLPPDAIVINTARGEVIDEAALIDALCAGRIFGAGLDTTEAEPLSSNSPLLNLPNVVLTPHAGGSTPAALAAMASAAAGNVLSFLRGEYVDPAACVNPQVFSRSSSTRGAV
ncbi:MAG: hydroxyacid dehydrogenase [Noviherbaspirillum sp.]